MRIFITLFSCLIGVAPTVLGAKLEELTAQVRTFQAEGATAKALYALQEIERTDASAFEVNNYPYLAGLLASQIGKDDLAKHYLEMAQRSRELFEYAARGLAALSRQRGNAGEERRYLEQLMNRRGSILADDAAYEHAMSYFREGSFEKALAELTGRNLAGNDLLFERIQCLRALGRDAEASRLVSTALRSRHQSDGLLKALGLIELNEDSQVIDHLPTDEITRRGDLYYENRNFERALYYYRILYDQRGVTSQKLIYMMGRTLDGAGRKADALAWFAQAEASLGFSYKFWAVWFQGEILFKRQDFTRAAETYRRALELASTSQQDLSVRLRIMSCQMLSGQKERALATMTEILERHRSMFSWMRFVAVKELVDLGKLADAVEKVQAMLTSEPMSSRAELLYWRGALQEQVGNLGEAIASYDTILRLHSQSFYAKLAETRLAETSLDSLTSTYAEDLARAKASLSAGQIEESRKELSYLYHRYPLRQVEVARILQDVYQRLPRYRDFLVFDLLQPRPLLTAAVPDSKPRSRAEDLAFLGCFDDAAKEMDAARGGRLVSISTLLTIADYYQRGGLPYLAMRRAESLMSLTPGGYEFDLLPRRMKELLYPLSYSTIVEKSAPSDLDIALFYSLIREESRFNTRARSPAGARGLLQFIPSTASLIIKEMGRGTLRDDDLYDPDLSIQIGSYYVAKLTRQFSQKPAPALASYNAGEEQGKLWLRMAGTGELHEYLAEVNYPETRNYIMRIMIGYYRYRSLYPSLAERDQGATGGARPTGGS